MDDILQDIKLVNDDVYLKISYKYIKKAKWLLSLKVENNLH